MRKAAKRFTFKRRIDYVKFYVSLIEAMSPLRRLSNKEMDVIAAFVALDKGFVAKFSTPYRRKVREQLYMSDSQMSNILKGLRESQVITEDEFGELHLHPAYQPPVDGAELTLKLEPPWESQEKING